MSSTSPEREAVRKLTRARTLLDVVRREVSGARTLVNYQHRDQIDMVASDAETMLGEIERLMATLSVT